MPRTVIIHGWSDSSPSFIPLKAFLAANHLGPVDNIFYADYESREDHITYNDIVHGLNEQFKERGFIDKDGKALTELNIVAHSTGGLVIRYWIWRYYGKKGRISDCPVKRIVLLAPANFGSPLAHRGKSFLAALKVGRRDFQNLLEVGKQILDGLEIASPFQWILAGDVINANPYFCPTGIQTTVLVGCDDYKNLSGVLMNKPGTDGTVIICGTCLNSEKLVLDFCQPPDAQDGKKPYKWDNLTPLKEGTAFAVLQGFNHGSLAYDLAPDNVNQVGQLMLEAFNLKNSQEFETFQNKLKQITVETYQKSGKPQYQQFLLHAVDDFDVSISDFTIEFFILRKKREQGAQVTDNDLDPQELQYTHEVNQILTEQFYTNSNDSSYRSFQVDLQKLEAFLARVKNDFGDYLLSMSIYVPKIDDGIQYDNKALQNIVLVDTKSIDKSLPQFFYQNTTTLIELRVNRLCSVEYVSVNPDPHKH